ncbi:hypothetical protein [Streptomyces sp. NPDC059262]|uniref:hypothetical protein n=1 Tax=Streptomyces sp. NPDC059262 TaxID=3346797 RepID=UPI0036933D73
MLRALAEHVDGDDTHLVQFGEAAAVVTWLHGVCAYAAGRNDWDLLEEAAQAMCTWDAVWDLERPGQDQALAALVER